MEASWRQFQQQPQLDSSVDFFFFFDIHPPLMWTVNFCQRCAEWCVAAEN
jgi:hypothetical protein